MSPRRRVARPFAFFAGLLAAVLVLPTVAFAAGPNANVVASPSGIGLAAGGSAQQATLLRYARDTWASLAAMTDPKSGLPADSLRADGTASVQTSTTNIGAYMWSAVVADRLGIITHADAVKRLRRTLQSLETMERYWPGGQFYNWYDHTTGAKLTIWPPTGEPINAPNGPILSSVDNGWLATGLQVVANSVPEVGARARALFNSMDFGFYYRADVNRIAFFYAPGNGRRRAVTTRS